ncbi:hypothetical protein TomTYG75_07250 [Sphingobium sp. TomTYG75]
MFAKAEAAVVAPVPPLATGTVLSVAALPSPRFVRASAAVVAPVPPELTPSADAPERKDCSVLEKVWRMMAIRLRMALSTFLADIPSLMLTPSQEVFDPAVLLKSKMDAMLMLSAHKKRPREGACC